MGAFIFVILVAVCSIFVYNILSSFKEENRCNIRLSKNMLILVSAFGGVILAGLLKFFLQYILIPLILLVLLYFIGSYYKNKRRYWHGRIKIWDN